MFFMTLAAVAIFSALIPALSQGVRQGKIETPIGAIQKARSPALFYALLSFLFVVIVECIASAAFSVYVRTLADSTEPDLLSYTYRKYELVIFTANVLFLGLLTISPILFLALTKGEIRTQLGVYQLRKRPLPFLFWLSFFTAILLLFGFAFYSAATPS